MLDLHILGTAFIGGISLSLQVENAWVDSLSVICAFFNQIDA